MNSIEQSSRLTQSLIFGKILVVGFGIALVVFTVLWGIVERPTGTFQLVGTALPAPPGGTSEKEIIRMTELTASQYELVQKSVSEPSTARGEFFHLIESANYIQMGDYYYEIQVQELHTNDYYTSLQNHIDLILLVFAFSGSQAAWFILTNGYEVQ